MLEFFGFLMQVPNQKFRNKSVPFATMLRPPSYLFRSNEISRLICKSTICQGLEDKYKNLMRWKVALHSSCCKRKTVCDTDVNCREQRKFTSTLCYILSFPSISRNLDNLSEWLNHERLRLFKALRRNYVVNRACGLTLWHANESWQYSIVTQD